MTYQVLARKWRPQDFASLIGQEPIVTALRNGLSENRIAQAYLFSGIRGVGKTTAARVLAKALNCQRGSDPQGPAADPCNECPPCVDIAAGSDIDFLEVDAATYSKVEQVRDLTESLRYGPARDRYKVVVLDEVHRLSRQAFDALLKIVEEPPAHLVFIFATTEIDTVPATILSRCQEYQFRRVPSAVLAQYLRQISDSEQIKVSDTALRLIARAGEGSVRDSVALLDQLATFGSGAIGDQDAKNLLGGLDTAIFLRLLAAILNGRGIEISEVVREIEATGWDPHSTFGQFLSFARDALQLAMGREPQSIDLPLEEADKLAELVAPAGYESLLRMIHLLLESEGSVRRSEFGMLAVQIVWLRAAELPKMARIEELLSGAPPTSSAGSGGSGVSGSRRAKRLPEGYRSTPVAAPQVDAATAEVPPAKKKIAETPEAATTENAPEVNDEVPSETIAPEPSEIRHNSMEVFLTRLASESPPLSGAFRASHDGLTFADGMLKIPEGDTQLTAALKRPHNLEIFEQLVTETWGRDAGWRWYTWEEDAAKIAGAQVRSNDRPLSSRSNAPRRASSLPVTNKAPPRRDTGITSTAKPSPNSPASGAHHSGWSGVSANGSQDPTAGRPRPVDEATLAEIGKDPVVQTVLEVFAGSKIQSVTTRAQGEVES